MARIRTIKPEFPQSESMGRVSRDARLLFVMLWTICDDSGRARGNSRMLASLLFPYDDDAPKLCGKWLDELAKENCVTLYEVGGDKYIEVANWLKHQKIDKPSPSKLPGPLEASRTFSKPRERSSEDLGPRTKDLGEEKKERSASKIIEPSTPRAKSLERLMAVMGLDHTALHRRPSFQNFPGLLYEWKTQGCDPERDVWPTIERIASRKKDITSPKFFEPAIFKARDDRLANEPTEAERWATRLEAYRLEKFWDRDQWGPPPDEPGTRAPNGAAA